MANLWFSGFETGDTTECVSTSGTVAVQSTVKRSGNWAGQINVATTGTGWFQFRGLTTTSGLTGQNFNVATCYFRMYFRYGTKPASGTEIIAQSLDSTSNTKFTLRINSSGQLGAYDQAGTVMATGSTALAQDTWYRIEMMVGTGAGTASWEVKIDGASEISGGSADLLAANNSRFLLGRPTAISSQSVNYYYDDIAVDDAAYPGAGETVRLDADANGNYIAWTGTVADVDDDLSSGAHDSDSTYVTTSSGSSGSPVRESVGFETATSAGINSYDTVIGVRIGTIVRDEGGAVSLRYLMRSGSTDLESSANNDPASTYVMRGVQSNTDPATSAAWVVSALDSIEAGVVSRSAVAVRCTSMWAMVEVQRGTPPATGSKNLPLLGVG